MRNSIVVSLLLSFWLVGSGHAQDCTSADPTSVLADINGDFEFTVDPDDPAANLIYVNHVATGPSQVVVARFDGRTGIVIPGTITQVADNFEGVPAKNGPEFVRPPRHGLGILYRAKDGVHGVFRPRRPRAWNDFSVDIRGARAGSSPPRLRSTYPGSYEAGGLPFDQYTYSLKLGACSNRCFADMRAGTPTDVGEVLAGRGLAVPDGWLAQGVREATVIVKACATKGADTGTCGLYEVAIERSGGLAAGPKKVASLTPDVGELPAGLLMAAARHPVTGTNVLYVAAAHETGRTIDVYEQRPAGGALTLVGSAPVAASDHFRIVDDGTRLLLHYIVFDGNLQGSYALSVEAANGRLVVGQSKMISTASTGAEVAYLPAARRFAIFFKSATPPRDLQRCFFDP